jgi:hypothetical protein
MDMFPTWPLDQVKTPLLAGESLFLPGYDRKVIPIGKGVEMRTTVLVSIIFLALLGLFVPNDSSYPSALLVGGEYTVQDDETRSGDMLLLFARVNVAEGGKVTGNILVIGGILEVSGRIGGNILAYGGEVNVKTPSAKVDGNINTIHSLRGLPAFPSILLVIS